MAREGLAIWILLVGAVCGMGQTTGGLTARLVNAEGAPAAAGLQIELVLAGGTRAYAVQTTQVDGTLIFPAVPPGDYELRTTGHQVLRGRLHVFVAQDTDLGIIALDSKAESDAASASVVEPTATAEVAALLTREQVEQLPVLDRNPPQLVSAVPGAGINSRSPTFSNGVRPGYTVVTLDGVNILDEFDRSGIDSAADRPLLDQVAEVAIVSANPSAGYGFGYPQVVLLTPSGTSHYHGSLYWQNRNSHFAANNWFNNRDGVARPFLNKNNFGGSFGGPLAKDRLIFYLNYEDAHASQQSRVNRTIFTEDARSGIYTYQDATRAVHKVNVLQAAGAQPDSAIRTLLQSVPGPALINNYLAGDSRSDLLRNTAGYSYNLGAESGIHNMSAKMDWLPALRHSFSVTYFLQRTSTGQPGLSNDFAPRAKVANVADADLFSLKWRWHAGPWTIETSGGRNGYSNVVDTSENFGAFLLTIPLISNPVNLQLPYGRYGTTWNVSSIATRVTGRHLIQVGYQWQASRSEPFDRFNVKPTCTAGVNSSLPGLPISAFPGMAPAELSSANALLALLAGSLTNCYQAFNVPNRTSGFVPGAENHGNFFWGVHAVFVEDQWRINPKLTLSLGLRYEIPTVVDVTNSLLLPVTQSNLGATLASNLSLDFSGAGTGRQPYRADRNNAAPRVGLAFRLDAAGKTIFRAAYGLSYVEDVSAPLMLIGLVNEGLHRIVLTGRSLPVSAGQPTIAAPVFQLPVTLAANYQSDSTQAVVLPDPGLRTPYIQQWTAGIERRFAQAAVEVRYVGNHAIGLLRGIDENQLALRENGFLDDFQRAATNGRLALQATGVYNPEYNPSIPGSSPLSIFPKLVGGGILTNPTVQSYLVTGQPAALAALYQVNRLNGPLSFFPNPYAYQTWLLGNHDQSSYDSLQIEVHTRRRGHFLTASYAYSKVLSNTAGSSASRLEPFLDINNPSLDRARAAFDQTHAFKLAGVWDLPLGKGHSLNCRPLEPVIGGWSLSAVVLVQSGAPFSILSGRATLTLATSNAAADSALTKTDLDRIVAFRQTGNGPSMIAASAIGPDGRGVAPDGQAPFSGQVFTNPRADSLGSLQRRMFNGPATILPVLALGKTARIGERQSVELRLEAVNAFNRPNWIVSDQSINSVTFGKITTAMDSRIVQFNLHYRF
jgi:hypothetical protein